MIIRKANKNDLANIMKVYLSCVNGMIKHGITQWDKKYPNTKIIEQDIIAKTYYVVIENDIIIAGINIDRKQDPAYLNIKWKDPSNKFLVIHRLAVQYKSWKKNIGKSLMKFAEELILKKHLKSIRLDTYNDNNKAIKFYKQLGYKQLGYIYLKPNKNEYYCFEKIIV